MRLIYSKLQIQEKTELEHKAFLSKHRFQGGTELSDGLCLPPLSLWVYVMYGLYPVQLSYVWHEWSQCQLVDLKQPTERTVKSELLVSHKACPRREIK
jgi:hypothetical protein